MKKYNPEELFISSMGTTYMKNENGKEYLKYEPSGYGIFRQYDGIYEEYSDIFSNVVYKKFHNYNCLSGNKAVNSPMKLTLFIQKEYEFLKTIDYIKDISNKIISSNSVSELDLKKFLLYLNGHEEIELDKPKRIFSKNIKIYTDLTKKKYKIEPCAGRDNEIKNLILSLPGLESNPILVGESGVGKTTIVDGLAYKIQKKDIPAFLKNKKIIELDMSNFRACEDKYEKLINLISYCIKDNAILFIDDIDKICDMEIYKIIEVAIKRKELKVIGTTTIEKYNKYFENSNFKKIIIDEPSDEDLKEIIKNIIDTYTFNTKISTPPGMDMIINTLIKLTKKENRTINTNVKVENEKIVNPYLVLQIISKIFAHAITNEQTELSIENIKFGINSCDKINDNVKEKCINSLPTILYVTELLNEKKRI